MMNFVAIDFETATSERNSACSVALVDIQASHMASSYSTLIKPPQTVFTPQNVAINGITIDMVKNAPTFADIFPQLRQIMENRTVIAHNASFDMSVMRYCMQEYNLPKIKFDTCCTVKISQKVWPDLYNHKLNTIGDFFNIKFSHHDALDDAKVCAKIPLVAGRTINAADFDTLISKIGLTKQPFKC